MAAAAAITALLLGGCTSGRPAAVQILAAPRAELTAVGFHTQSAFHCGPAALATVLEWTGVTAAPAALAEQIYVPEREGSLRAELMAAVRRHGRVAYPVSARLDAALREVAGGRPVLVLQDLGAGITTAWHYAVLIGFDLEAAQVVLRSGSHRRLQMSMRAFDRSWAPGGRWGLVVLEPGQLPAEVDRAAYLRAVAPLERIAQWDAAEQAWRAALSLWPDDLAASLGLANARYQLGNAGEAASILERTVSRHPDSAPAHNNLAHVLGELGARQRARAHARRAVALGGPGAAEFNRTLEALGAQR